MFRPGGQAPADRLSLQHRRHRQQSCDLLQSEEIMADRLIHHSLNPRLDTLLQRIGFGFARARGQREDGSAKLWGAAKAVRPVHQRINRFVLLTCSPQQHMLFKEGTTKRNAAWTDRKVFLAAFFF